MLGQLAGIRTCVLELHGCHGDDQLFELRRRTFDTPELQGIEFLEGEVKTIINHVPGNFLPFSWTINPYRGCSHSCSYCVGGDTPILMMDGRHKPMGDVRVGDEVCGTIRDLSGKYRRYAKSRVLAHWQTVKLAFRLTLEDGTELVCSGDHRFLTNRGWKFVAPAPRPAQRPFLARSNELMGTGAFATPPQHDSDYRQGYLCGMIRGDGHLGSYSYVRPRRRKDDVHRFRLALADLEALQRTRRFLDGLDITTARFVF